jgi:hypothetical protein
VGPKEKGHKMPDNTEVSKLLKENFKLADTYQLLQSTTSAFHIRKSQGQTGETLEYDVVDGLAPLLSDALKNNTVNTLIENMDQLAVSKERQATAMSSSDEFGSIDNSAKKLRVVGTQLSRIRDTVTMVSHSIQQSGSKVIAPKTSYRTACSAYDPNL